MPKTAFAASTFAQIGDVMKKRTRKRLKNKLSDALAREHSVAYGACVKKKNKNFSPVVGVNHSYPLGHSEAFYRAEAAAGVNKTGDSGSERLNGDAGGDASSLSGRDDEGFMRFRAGPQIGSGGFLRGRRNSAFAIQGGGVSKKTNVYAGLQKRKACHRASPV